MPPPPASPAGNRPYSGRLLPPKVPADDSQPPPPHRPSHSPHQMHRSSLLSRAALLSSALEIRPAGGRSWVSSVAGRSTYLPPPPVTTYSTPSPCFAPNWCIRKKRGADFGVEMMEGAAIASTAAATATVGDRKREVEPGFPHKAEDESQPTGITCFGCIYCEVAKDVVQFHHQKLGGREDYSPFDHKAHIERQNLLLAEAGNKCCQRLLLLLFCLSSCGGYKVDVVPKGWTRPHEQECLDDLIGLDDIVWD